jgi:hypothetical protein
MQLVDRQKTQLTGRLADQRPLLRPDQHVFEHHVVGQQNMRRVVQQLLAHFLAGMAGILREAHRAERPVRSAKNIQRLDLAVDQRIHRIDDQCAYAVARRIVAHDHVKDRNQIGQALPRPSARRDDVIVATPRCCQCLGLVPMEPQTRSKKLRGVAQDRATRREFAQCRSLLVSGVQLQDSFGPQLASASFARTNSSIRGSRTWTKLST